MLAPVSIPEPGGEPIGFAPLRQLNGYALRRLPNVSAAAGVMVKVAGENVLRQLLMVYTLEANNPFALRPSPDGSYSFFSSSSPVDPRIIHAAAYPLLCQGAWYAAGAQTSTFAVFEVYQQQT